MFSSRFAPVEMFYFVKLFLLPVLQAIFFALHLSKERFILFNMQTKKYISLLFDMWTE